MLANFLTYGDFCSLNWRKSTNFARLRRDASFYAFLYDCCTSFALQVQINDIFKKVLHTYIFRYIHTARHEHYIELLRN